MRFTLSAGNISSSLLPICPQWRGNIVSTAKDNGAITNIWQNGRDGATLEIMLNNTNASVEGQKVEFIVTATRSRVPGQKSPPTKSGHATVTLTTVKAGHYTVNARVTDGGQHSVESLAAGPEFVPDINSAVLNLAAPC